MHRCHGTARRLCGHLSQHLTVYVSLQYLGDVKTTFRRLGASARAIALMMGFMAAAQSAHAACTGPNGNAGDIISHQVLPEGES